MMETTRVHFSVGAFSRFGCVFFVCFIIAVLCLVNKSNGQTYKLDYTFTNDNMSNKQALAEQTLFTSLSIGGNTLNSGANSQSVSGTIYVASKPTFYTVFSKWIEWEQATPTEGKLWISNCTNTSAAIAMSIGSCGTYATGNKSTSCTTNYSFTINSFTPVAPLTAPNAGTYCESDNLSVSVPGGFSSYQWYYDEGAGWTLIGSSNSLSIKPSDLFGGGYESHLNKNISFMVSVEGCVTQTSGTYKFARNPLVVADVSKVNKTPLTCYNSNDGTLTVTAASLNRTGDLSTITATTLVNLSGSNYKSAVGTTITAIAPGTYYILVETAITPCGPVIHSVGTVTFANPSAVTATASVSSSYNGAQISCPGLSDGAITINASGGTGSFRYSSDNFASERTVGSFTGLSAGNYNMYIKDTNGCNGTFSTANPVVVSNPAALVVSNAYVSSDYNDRAVSCAGMSDGKITLVSTGGTGGIASMDYSKNGSAFQSITFTKPSAGNYLVSGLPAATYKFNVKDLNGCSLSYTGSVEIEDTPALILGTATGTNPICTTSPGGSIAITGSGGGTPFLTGGSYRYSKDNSSYQTVNILSPLTASPGPGGTNYNVYVKDANGCTVTTSVKLISPDPIIVAAPTLPVTCLNGSDGKINAQVVSGGQGALQFSIDPILAEDSYQDVGTFTVTKGLYTVTVRDSKGCTGQKTAVEVGQQPTLAGTVNETVSILCHGDTGLRGATLDLTPAGGPSTGVYSYAWSSSTATNFANTEDVTQLPAGVYSVKISKDICSTTLPNITISEPDELKAALTKTDVSCNVSHGAALSSNGSIDLSPAGGTTPYVFDWTGNIHTEDLSNLVSGTYDIKVTDAHGCEATNTATLIEPPTVTSSIGSFTDVTCNGFDNGVITIAAAGGSLIYSYSLNGGTAQPSAVFSSLPPGDYTIDVLDSKGCSSQTGQRIVEPDELLISTGDIVNTTCGNSNGSATSTTTGGILPYSYRWEDVSNQLISTTANLTSAAGGAYNVIVTDQRNCTNTALALISSSDGPQIQRNSITATSCFNSPDGKADVTVSAGVAPYRVSWNNGETGTTPVALFPGSNIITVKDDHDCVVVELVNVPHPDPVAINTKTITPPTCPGSSDAAIALMSKGGSGVYTYDWGNGNTTSGINNVPAGDYGVTIKDSKLCTLVTSVKVDAIPDLKLSIATSKLPTCFGGSDGAMTVAATGGNGTYSYLWANNTAGSLLNNIAAGSYTVKVTDQRGCNSSSAFVLDNPVKFVFNIEDKTICVGQKYKLVSEVSNGTYQWSSPNGFSSTQREVILTDAGTYRLQVIDAKGCLAEDSFELKTSRDLLHADMLMVTEAFEKDTVVVIDLSWPLPDASTWIFPTEASVIENNAQLGYAFIQFDQSGGYDVSLQVSLGECVDKYSQMITILGGERPNSTGGRQGKMDLIKYVEVYPNPNKGEFEIEAELTEIASARMIIVNTEGNKVLVNVTDEGKAAYKWQVSIPEVNQGTYFIVLKAGDETKAIRMLKL